MIVDLNAARAARAAARGGEQNGLQLGVDENGAPRVWRLKAELPLSTIDLLTSGNLKGAWRSMLENPDDYEAMEAAGLDPSKDDIEALVAGMAGVELGNS